MEKPGEKETQAKQNRRKKEEEKNRYNCSQAIFEIYIHQKAKRTDE
jgi:hypothetical protein